MRRLGPRRLAQAPLGPVALHRAADPAGGGEAQADVGPAVAARPRLHQHRAAGAGEPLGRGEEVGALAKSFDVDGGFGQAAKS
jgi:hypothetical protein